MRLTSVKLGRTTPVLRMFDVAKAREFYVDFLGFEVDWEYRFGDDFPLYMQLSRATPTTSPTSRIPSGGVA